MLRLAVLVCLIFVSRINCYGQDGYIGVSEGLSNRFVTSIIQDHKGLIWVSTSNGLNVYDGYTFRSFYPNSRDLKLTNSRISCLSEDANGNLWVGTDKGLNRISADRSSNTIINDLVNRNICSLTIVDGTQVLLGTSDGVILLVDPSGNAKILHNENRDVAINGIQRDSSGNIWFFTNSERKLFKLDSTLKPDPYFHFNDRVPSNFIVDGTRLIASGESKKGLAVYNVTNDAPAETPFFDSLNTIYQRPVFLLRSEKSTIWAAYPNGVLLKIDPVNKRVDNFSHRFRRGYFGSRINTMMEDENGLLWVGTDGGIVKLETSANAFTTFYRNIEPGNPDRFISTRGMVEDDKGNVYVASYKGLLKITPSGKIDPPVVLSTATKDATVAGKNESVVPFRMRWDGNKILMTTLLDGLFYFKPGYKTLEPAVNSTPGRVEKELFGLLTDSEGITWVGTRKGLRVFDRTNRSLIKSSVDKDEVITSMVWIIIEHPKNIIWAGSNKGLFRIDKSTNSIRHFQHTSTPSLSNEEILCIEPGDDSTVWLGSRGGGLMKLNIYNDSIRYFNTLEGLTSNIVYGIVRDEKYLWLSTENGICRFDPKTNQGKGYYEKDGLSNNEFNNASYLKSSAGRIYFGGIDGITAFFPHELQERKFNGKILLTSLKIGTDEKVNEISDGGKISIPYDNRNLTIEVALTDYYRPQANHFFYRLDGDSTWVRIGNQNSLHLSQLPAGDHSIQILGKNLNDQQSLNTLTLHVNVQQVFYKQAWFIAMILLTLIAVTWSFFKLKLNQLMEMQRLRTKIASDLHDEVGSMLTRISILTEVLKIKNQNHSEVEHIALASRQATSTMSDVLWSVDARNDKIENLVDRLRDHTDSLLHPKNIDINFKIEGDATKELNMQTRQNLLLIFKEAINNIARHSNATRVEIGLKAGKNELSVVIKDNGTIAPFKNGKGSGQGLKNMQMRAKEINALLTFQNGDGFSVILHKKV